MGLGQAYSQECGKVDSGFRGGGFNIYYEQRHLTIPIDKLRDLPENVRTQLSSYLNKKLGDEFAQKLKFDGGQYLDLNRLKQEFPNLYESNLKYGAYDLLFYFSDKANGLKSFYSKLVLNEDGSVSQGLNLPDIAENSAKGIIISCKEASEIAEKNGFPKKYQSQWFEYNDDLKTFIWEIHDRRPTTPDESLWGLTGKGTYYQIQINANTGEVIKKYKYTIIV
jgi:hypothetical protein